MAPGLRQVDGNPSAPPYSNGPYEWDQKLFPTAQGGSAPANALLGGIGTSADPATTSTAGKVFFEYRCQSTATSGDNRFLYMRYELNGTGGGECLRAFTKVTAVVATARGAHISLDVSTAGEITGLGVGVDAQLLLPGETGHELGHLSDVVSTTARFGITWYFSNTLGCILTESIVAFLIVSKFSEK